MNTYVQNINQILALKANKGNESDKQVIERCSIEIIATLKQNHKIIQENESKDFAKSYLRKLILKIIQLNVPDLTILFKEILQILYLKDSSLLKAVYLCLPCLLAKIIENQDKKSSDLDSITKVISDYEGGTFKRFLKDRQNICKSSFLKDLFSIHFNKTAPIDPQGLGVSQQKGMQMQESQSVNTDRSSIKALVLSMIYRNLTQIDEISLSSYLKMIYFYCGGQAALYESASSFYLLEKKNMFNLFKYSISSQEIEWMLLSLYELSISSNKYKFQLLAAINMIYKKAANQSMFKYSEIAQSVIHLLEDQYCQIFS